MRIIENRFHFVACEMSKIVIREDTVYMICMLYVFFIIIIIFIECNKLNGSMYQVNNFISLFLIINRICGVKKIHVL